MRNNNNKPSTESNAKINKVKQLFARIVQEIEEKDPANVIHFVVDFLCKHYPKHLVGFASVWNADPDLERDRLQVVEFFKFQKLPTEIAAQFTSAGFDTLETLCTITPEALDDIEKFNQATWLPGHRVRLQQTFTDIVSRVRAYRQEREKLLHMARLNNGHCDHPTIVTRTNAPYPVYSTTSVGPNPMPIIRPLEAPPKVTNVSAPLMSNVVMSNHATGPYVVTPIN